MIFGCGLGISDDARGFFSCPQRGKPQAARVSANTLHHPVIVSLVGIAAVLRHAPTVIELAKIFDRVFHRRPGLAQKLLILATGQDVIAIDHEHKLRVEIFPVIRVLPAGLVDGDEWIAFGYSEIVRHRPNLLALVSNRLPGLLGLPNPQPLLGPFFRHCIGELA